MHVSSMWTAVDRCRLQLVESECARMQDATARRVGIIASTRSRHHLESSSENLENAMPGRAELV